MKILLIFRSPLGGLFRHVKDLIEGIRSRGHSAAVVFDSSSPCPPSTEHFLRNNAALGVLRLPISRLPSPHDVLNGKRIANFIGRHRFDIIHGHGAKGGMFARFLSAPASSSGPKAFYTLHGGSLHYEPSSLVGWTYLSAERLMLRRTSGLIFESEFARNRFITAIGEPTCLARTIYNGLHPSEFEPLVHTGRAADFVFLGELRTLKGVDVLLRALRILQDRGREVALDIFGSGPNEDAFRALARQLQLRNVQWHGPALNAREALRHGRCLVLPSLAESLPYVVIEAVAMRVPVLATRVGGVPEILDGERDWVIPGDIRDLADKMSRFIDHTPLVSGDIDELRRRATRLFAVDTMIDETLDFYGAALRGEN